MKTFQSIRSARSGRAPLLLMWLLGVPLPIIALIFLFQGCHG
jgi:hypothetical protein